MSRPVYLCGPINGRTDADCKNWRDFVTAKLAPAGIATLDPMRRDYRGREHEAVNAIVEDDKVDIEACSTLLVYFDKPSVGTSMEVILGWQSKKLIVIVNASDKPLSPWLIYHSHKIVNSLEEAIVYLKDTLSPQSFA